MRQPKGYNDETGRVCKLKRSLYGLKQSPRCWNRRFTDFIKKQKMKRSSANPCLFTRKKNDKKLIIVIYVDDGLIAESGKREIDFFVKELKKEFKVTIGFFDSFLKIQVKQQEDGSIFITQRLYAKKILEKFGIAQSKSVSTPIEGQIKDSDSEEALKEQISTSSCQSDVSYDRNTSGPSICS